MSHNRKVFLAHESLYSSSMIHCKMYPNGKGMIRISDCNHSIRLWNDLKTPEGKAEMLEKIYTLKQELNAFETMIKGALN